MNSFLDKFSETNYQGNPSQKLNSYDEAVVLTNRKKITRHLILAIGIVALVLGLCLWSPWRAKRVMLVDFTGWLLEDVTAWAETNQIRLLVKTTYEDTHEKDLVIQQSLASNTMLRRNDFLELLISAGPDPDEVVGFIVPKNASINQVEQLIKEKKLLNVRFDYIHDATIPQQSVVYVEYDKSEAKDFRRKDKAIVYVSLGPFPQDLKMPSFVGLSREEVMDWRDANEFVVEFKFVEVYSLVTPGVIVQQDITPGETLSKDTVVTFTVSKGQQILTPNYGGSIRSEFDLIDSASLSVLAIDCYSDTVPYGSFIRQSIPAGTDVTGSVSKPLYVYYSIGKPFIEDLIGYSENRIAPYFFNEFKAKGANIEYIIRYDKNAQAPYGTVAKISKRMEFLSLDDRVEIIVSKNRGYGD